MKNFKLSCHDFKTLRQHLQTCRIDFGLNEHPITHTLILTPTHIFIHSQTLIPVDFHSILYSVGLLLLSQAKFGSRLLLRLHKFLEPQTPGAGFGLVWNHLFTHHLTTSRDVSMAMYSCSTIMEWKPCLSTSSHHF